MLYNTIKINTVHRFVCQTFYHYLDIQYTSMAKLRLYNIAKKVSSYLFANYCTNWFGSKSNLAKLSENILVSERRKRIKFMFYSETHTLVSQ